MRIILKHIIPQTTSYVIIAMTLSVFSVPATNHAHVVPAKQPMHSKMPQMEEISTLVKALSVTFSPSGIWNISRIRKAAPPF